MYFSRLLFPPQPYSVILSVHNGSLLCFPEDSGVHIERVAPLLLFTVACCQNTGYFLLQDQKPISLRQAFNCHPTQQVLKICGFLLNTSCLMGSKIPRQRERQNRLSFGNPCYTIILRFSHCLPIQQHPQLFVHFIHMFQMHVCLNY